MASCTSDINCVKRLSSYEPDGLRCLSAMKCRGHQRQLCLFLSHILYCILKSHDKYIGKDYSCFNRDTCIHHMYMIICDYI